MGPLLGVRPEQLARWYDYDGVIADQLQTLAALGVAPVSSATPFISPHQPNETIEHRVRGYMAGNCMHCHNPHAPVGLGHALHDAVRADEPLQRHRARLALPSRRSTSW